MERKYQVFISSTKIDLEKEREAVYKAISEMGCIPVGMELFVTGEQSWDLIKKDIDNSDFYLLISAGCYGTIDEEDKISYTEKEYNYAKGLGKKTLIFVYKDIEELSKNKVDKNTKNIINFRKKIMGCRDNVCFWKDCESLTSEVKNSLSKAMIKDQDGGWIRVENGRFSDDQAEIVEKWGLEKIFRTRAEKNAESDPILQLHNTKKLDGIAFGLSNFRTKRRSDIIENLNKGMEMRLIVMDPDSDFAKQRAIEEGDETGKTISKSINELIQWVDGIKKEIKAGSIEIKVYNSMTLDFYWRMDDVLYVGPYLFEEKSQQTITMKFTKPGRGFEDYTEYFERLWNNDLLCRNPFI